MALKWGIASTGTIAQDFAVALEVLPKTDHIVTAVAARNHISAEEFAKKLNIPNAYQGYEKLGDDPNVDIVYVGVRNPQHYEVTKLLLEKGKHVLCEKPFTMNEKQARKLVAIARERKLFLMEGIWSRCFPVYKEMQKIIASGEIGEVMQVTVHLGLHMMHKDRLRLKEFGGGISLSIAIYILQFQQYVFRGLKPTKIVACGHLNEHEVDHTVAAILTYPGGKTASLSASGVVDLPNQGCVFGTKGSIKVNQVWCPTSMEVNGEIRTFPLIENDGEFININSAGLAYEAEDVRICLNQGKIECPLVTHEESIQLAQWTDKLRAEVGVVFPADLEDC